MANRLESPDPDRILSAQELLAGAHIVHEVEIPPEILQPARGAGERAAHGSVRLRPLSVAALTVISRAAREDAGLVPLLTIKESLVEPVLTMDQVRQMPVGMAVYLVSRINQLSGLSADGEALNSVVDTPISQAHILLARHFGWTPDEVSQLTPGQMAVYLAGIERLATVEADR
jgi:hypothetical protein